jgi:hypothetical protein
MVYNWGYLLHLESTAQNSWSRVTPGEWMKFHSSLILVLLRMELYWSGSSIPLPTFLSQQHPCQAIVALLSRFYLLATASTRVLQINQSGFVALTPSTSESMHVSDCACPIVARRLALVVSYFFTSLFGNSILGFLKQTEQGAHILLDNLWTI